MEVELSHDRVIKPSSIPTRLSSGFQTPVGWRESLSPRTQRMASLKIERPVGSQALSGEPKKEAPKVGGGSAKAQGSKPAPKKAEHKPREPKKRAKAGKPAAKN